MRRRNSWLLSVVVATPLVALAQDSAPQQPPAAPGTQSPPAAAAPVASQPAPASSASGRDDVFVPTQQLSADEAVTFPVDI